MGQRALHILGFTNTLHLSSPGSIVLHHVLPDTCPVMTKGRMTSRAIMRPANILLMLMESVHPQSSRITQGKSSGMTMISSLQRDAIKTYGE